MTKQERDEKLIDLKARQLAKQRQLDELNPEASTEETINAIVEEIKVIQEEIAEIEKVVPVEETPAEEPAEVEEKADEEELSQEEIDEENEELKEEEERRKMSKNEVRTVKIETAEERAKSVKEREERAKLLREGRSVTVSSGSILLPEHQADELATYPFQPVTSFMDMVNVVNLKGGETYKKAFVKDYGVGGTTAEGADYADAEPEFGYATNSKVKITAYAELSEEVLKLSDLNYEAEVLKGVEVALKKKMAQQAIAGAGTTNTFKGILADGVEALETTDVVNISAITDTTLDEILYSFGGDEEVMGNGVLILNKLDLKSFATLRNNDGTKTYNVDYKAQTIDGIPYVINSNLTALAATEAGKTCMLFGTPKGYDVTIFSDVDIQKSTDFKFKQGIVCYKADVFAGGNVGAYRSFVKVNKQA